MDFYQNKWVSYADQLNWGLQNTGIDTEWSMRMDADEEIMEDLAAEIDEKLPNVKAPVNGIILRRRVYFMGRWIKHGGRYPELLLRIFRTGKASCEMKVMGGLQRNAAALLVWFPPHRRGTELRFYS